MAAATCPSHQPYDLGGLGGPDLQPRAAPGLQQPAAGPSGAARPQQPQQQKHSKPFFYVQPQQPYVPMQGLQWPLPVHMPMSYNPYFGYPGLGYGMPMMPHYQPNPYVEPPSFIVPHTPLHLMDYRRMLNPQYYQTMAYHSRRFHYKHNSQPKETTTSQVQTEPLVSPQRTGGLSSPQVKSPDVLLSRRTPSSELPFASSAVQNMADPPTEVGGSPGPSTSMAPSTSSFTIQTEEVRIECCSTPAGLQLLHARETAEVSRDFSEDLVTCSSILQRHVLQEEASSLPVDQAKQALQVCPDILMGGTLGEKIPAALEESRNQTDSTTEPFVCESQEATCNALEKLISEKVQTGPSSELNLKIVHLPFDAKYLDELRKMESSVWSNEETLIPSPESQLQDVSRDSHDETLIPAAEAEILMFSEDVVTEEVPDTSLLEEDEEENQVSSLETLGDEMMVDHPSTGLSEDAHVGEESETAEVPLRPDSPLTTDRNQGKRDSKIQDHQDTSFESLPAYLPSTSWFSDFDNVYICSKVQQAPETRYRPESSSGLDVPTRRRKQELDHRDAPNARKMKDRYKPKGKADHWSLSDHEYCLSRSFIENNTYVSKRDQLCSKCVEKHGMSASPGASPDRQSLKRKAIPFQQRNDGVSRMYKVCRSRPNRHLAKRGSSLDVCGSHAFDTEGESSENSWRRSGPKWLNANEPVKRPLLSRQNVERYPTPGNQKLRENCLHSEGQRQHAPWERLCHCPHGNAIREMDENCSAPPPLRDQWRNHVYVKQRWQTESSWKAVMQSEDIDGSSGGARSQLLIHRKSQPLSQGSRTKDTRC